MTLASFAPFLSIFALGENSFSLPAGSPESSGGKGITEAKRKLVKVLKEIIACIKIFTPVDGLKLFP